MSEIARSGGFRASAPVRGLLLAAGAGMRLRPLTNALPKPAVPLLDVPLGGFGLRMLQNEVGAGVVMNVSHLGSVAADVLGPLFPGLQVFDEGETPLGTAGTLAALAPSLAERLVTVNGDLLADLDLADLSSTHDRAGAPATLAVAKVPERADFEGRDGRLTRMIDRRGERFGPPGYRYIGAAIFERGVADLVPDGRPVGLAEAVFGELARRGDLAYHLHEGYARDVGTLARYLGASFDLVEGRGPTFGAPGEILDVPGGVAYLGPGASAAEGSVGPGAVILAGARVEGRVRRAVVWPGEHVAADQIVEGTVWFSNTSLIQNAPVEREDLET